MKYWFGDFRKKFFYLFSERIGTFYRRKIALPSAVTFNGFSNEKFCPLVLWKTFPLHHLKNWSNWGKFTFWTSETNSVGYLPYEFWTPFSFLLFLAWFDAQFYLELNKIYFMVSKVQSKSKRVQNCEIQISRVTYILIKNFIPSVKKFTSRGC
jgi:hypothetical protein